MERTRGYWRLGAAAGLLCAVLLAGACAPHAVGKTVYVNGTCGSDAWSGLSPDCVAPNGPKATIQAGINASVNGDTVLVADGVYAGVGNRDLVVSQLAITVRSTNGPDSCTIDCEGAGRGFLVTSGSAALVTIEGFAIINGTQTIGGGIRCALSTITVRDCVIADNTADSGAGIYSYYCDARIEGCVIEGNVSSLHGGGVYTLAGRVQVVGCRVAANHASSGYGGGMYFLGSYPKVFNCTVSGNHSFVGAGIFSSSESANLANCVVTGNSATWGAGIESWDVNPRVLNCSIHGNRAVGGGGGIRLYSSQGSKIIANSVVWGNSAPAGPQLHLTTGPAGLLIEYNNIQGGQDEAYVDPDTVLVWGDGNIDADPLFAGPGYWDDGGTPEDPADDAWIEGDYHISAGGPGIDAGSNTRIPQDDADLDGDGDTLEPVPFDIDGTPRRTNDPATDDTGEGDAPVVDMGAYEYDSDCNGNGVPDYQDLADQTSEDLNGNAIPDECETMLMAVAEGDCFGEQMVCWIAMTHAQEVIVGGQFFMWYDTTRLRVASIVPGDNSRGDPDNPFEREIFEYVDEAAGHINYVVGIPDGVAGTASDVNMAKVTFDVLDSHCQPEALVTFRSNVFPHTTRLSGELGHPVVPDPVSLGIVALSLDLRDLTCDCLVDFGDCLRFFDCMSGPDNLHPVDCERADQDLDLDVDMADLAVYQQIYGD